MMLNDQLFVPPIKCQGIKTKLIPSICDIIRNINYSRWIEPFFGSGVVGFNVRPKEAIFADSNPHLVNFYNALKNQSITPNKARNFLEKEGDLLETSKGEHYYIVRERFNKDGDPLDFLFINRSCFNGMIRFNSKGGFNVPFCRKPNRFAQAYITKITNQIKYIQEIILLNNYTFICQPFSKTIEMVTKDDLVYCDPPYIGRHVDYFDSWAEQDERDLNSLLIKSGAKFILSTWHSNDYRKNEYIETLWNNLNILTIKHFYHVGATEENRKPILEALISNFSTSFSKKEEIAPPQLTLFPVEPFIQKDK